MADVSPQLAGAFSLKFKNLAKRGLDLTAVSVVVALDFVEHLIRFKV